jgi:hypothetical protein
MSTPLHIAAEKGHVSVIELLLGGGEIMDSCDGVSWDRCWGNEQGAYYLHDPSTDETIWESELEERVSYEVDIEYLVLLDIFEIQPFYLYVLEQCTIQLFECVLIWYMWFANIVW